MFSLISFAFIFIFTGFLVIKAQLNLTYTLKYVLKEFAVTNFSIYHLLRNRNTKYPSKQSDILDLFCLLYISSMLS